MVSEEQLPLQQRSRIASGRRSLGDFLEVDQSPVDPVPVGGCAREFGLDLRIGNDPMASGVHEKHASRFEAPLLQHLGRGSVEHAALTGQHDTVVLHPPPSPWAKTVAIQHGPDNNAVAERHGRRTVPRFHQTTVKLVEGLYLVGHRRIVLPGSGNHHRDGVLHTAAPERQKLQYFVERRRVGSSRGADRKQAIDVPT